MTTFDCDHFLSAELEGRPIGLSSGGCSPIDAKVDAHSSPFGGTSTQTQPAIGVDAASDQRFPESAGPVTAVTSSLAPKADNLPGAGLTPVTYPPQLERVATGTVEISFEGEDIISRVPVSLPSIDKGRRAWYVFAEAKPFLSFSLTIPYSGLSSLAPLFSRT